MVTFRNSYVQPDCHRGGAATLYGRLAAINQFPSTLLWLKLGGIAHILVGIFVALAAIIRALVMMPDRLGATLAGAAADD